MRRVLKILAPGLLCTAGRMRSVDWHVMPFQTVISCVSIIQVWLLTKKFFKRSTNLLILFRENLCFSVEAWEVIFHTYNHTEVDQGCISFHSHVVVLLINEEGGWNNKDILSMSLNKTTAQSAASQITTGLNQPISWHNVDGKLNAHWISLVFMKVYCAHTQWMQLLAVQSRV